jgi:hypothetical protein
VPVVAGSAQHDLDGYHDDAFAGLLHLYPSNRSKSCPSFIRHPLKCARQVGEAQRSNCVWPASCEVKLAEVQLDEFRQGCTTSNLNATFAYIQGFGWMFYVKGDAND